MYATAQKKETNGLFRRRRRQTFLGDYPLTVGSVNY
jgi:hypothetical protein